MSLQLIRTNTSHPGFRRLVSLLDLYLSIKDKEEHQFYKQYNTLDEIPHVVVAMVGDIAMGCGALKIRDGGVVEIKRMFTHPTLRGKGIATQVLGELEKWASELNATHIILETGLRQPEAIALYQKSGYEICEKFAPYTDMENSVCFRKPIQPAYPGTS